MACHREIAACVIIQRSVDSKARIQLRNVSS